jgi:hypothetical protein
MVNRRRGEVGATIAGERYRLCLTLGSLAELEEAFGVDDLSALASRFSAGSLSTNDLVRLFGAGLRGGGHVLSDDDVRSMPVADALHDIAAAVAALLEATFGGSGEGDAPADPSRPQPA